MAKDLIIVESPAKAKTISRFLGEDYIIKASMGHIRDLPAKDLGVDVERDFNPHYVIPADKKKIIAELKKNTDQADTIMLASDEDREGEAISWHLAQVLKLDEQRTKRIVFHEITKQAIEEAIANPRMINKNLVDAQQARRVLDRLVGFELSPLLWKKIKPALSAGRVQSVAVRLVVEREKEISNFTAEVDYKVSAVFYPLEDNRSSFKADLAKNFKTAVTAREFLQNCSQADFGIAEIETRPAQKSPAPPFTTSTLQQEASRKLGFSVSKTMMVAQQLYEAGLITYMRTDSVNLSKLALGTIKEEIHKCYGKEYAHARKYSTKTKGAQEAHEAIRPSYIKDHEIEGTKDQQRLYSLIWKRAIASQMSNAVLEKTTVKISISGLPDQFIARGETIKFEGFLKVYTETRDEDNDSENEGLLPSLAQGQLLGLEEMTATQRYSKPPVRYSEAGLVRKLEELGIGRPSTYAPTISTIQKREYVIRADRAGEDRELVRYCLKDGSVSETVIKEKFGMIKNRFLPTDIGQVVNEFLEEYFNDIVDYNFTAQVEKEFDDIAEGKKSWNEMIKEFYAPFKSKILQTLEDARKFSGERLLGQDPQSGLNIYAKIGRYGLIVQKGESKSDVKPEFASLQEDQTLQGITLEEALELFKFPRDLGKFEDSVLTVALGKFGPYVKHKGKFISIDKDDPARISRERAIELVLEKRKSDQEKIIRQFDQEPELKILKGRWGPYIAFKGKNYKIPKQNDPENLTLEECLEIIKNTPVKSNTGRNRRFGKR